MREILKKDKFFEEKIKVAKLFREKREAKKRVKNRWRLIEQGHCRPTKNSILG